MVYGNSCEEHKYLAGIRREEESFERLIKERGVRLSLLHYHPAAVDLGSLWRSY